MSTSGKHIDVFTRQDDGAWLMRSYSTGEHAALGSIDVRLSVDTVYAGAVLIERSGPG